MVTRRLPLSSLFHGKARDTSPSRPPPATAVAAAWPWPSSKSTCTQSTRSAQPPVGTRTVASIVLDSAESSFTASSARQDCSDSLSTASDTSASAAPVAACDDEADDAVVRGIRSDRLLFDPGASATSSILEEKSGCAGARGGGGDEEAFGDAVAVAFESADPYEDFRASMEEMVAAHGVGDWGWLEEMLGWYLRANDRDTHGAIVAAFIDVVVAIADPSREACSSQSSSCTFAAGELEEAKRGSSKPAGVLTV